MSAIISIVAKRCRWRLREHRQSAILARSATAARSTTMITMFAWHRDRVFEISGDIENTGLEYVKLATKPRKCSGQQHDSANRKSEVMIWLQVIDGSLPGEVLKATQSSTSMKLDQAKAGGPTKWKQLRLRSSEALRWDFYSETRKPPLAKPPQSPRPEA